MEKMKVFKIELKKLKNSKNLKTQKRADQLRSYLVLQFSCIITLDTSELFDLKNSKSQASKKYFKHCNSLEQLGLPIKDGGL